MNAIFQFYRVVKALTEFNFFIRSTAALYTKCTSINALAMAIKLIKILYNF